MKNTMTLLFLLASSTIFSQAQAVIDVTANKNLARQLVTSSEQLTQLEKSYKLLEDAKEKYEKVSSIVSSVYQLKEIIELQAEAIENINLVVENTKLEGKYLTMKLEIMTSVLSKIDQKVELISNVLSDGFFNMSDKERIDMFDKAKSYIFMQTAKTSGYAGAYKD